ncbi:MAG: hypothetical protein FWH52_05130 [Synergistaceae bacterium]|nr:hypothetical protein [Synergistaceae bacterium]
MTTLEMVEKLREKANVTYDEAKEALESCGNDLLEAMILLEKQGKIRPPQSGGYYNSKQGSTSGDGYYQYGYHGAYHKESPASDFFSRLFKLCARLIHKANTNSLEVRRHDKYIIALPLSILIIFIIFFTSITIPLLVIGLFFGFRYSFRGDDIEKTNFNSAMDTAADAVESIKDEITNSFPNNRE